VIGGHRVGMVISGFSAIVGRNFCDNFNISHASIGILEETFLGTISGIFQKYQVFWLKIEILVKNRNFN